MTPTPSAPNFAPTRWTLIQRTRGNSPEAHAALVELCSAYYAPVVAFLQREISEKDSPRDLAHEFFAKILEGGSLANADPQRGRFRNYLLGALKHFLLNKHRAAATEKRGGRIQALSVHPTADTDSGMDMDIVDPRPLPPDACFDRQWALTLIDRALAALQAEQQLAGNADQFNAVKPWLSPAGASQSQAQTAAQLHTTESALKVTIHRLRKRFRDLVRAEISQTLNNPADLEEEMRHLIDALVAR